MLKVHASFRNANLFSLNGETYTPRGWDCQGKHRSNIGHSPAFALRASASARFALRRDKSATQAYSKGLQNHSTPRRLFIAIREILEGPYRRGVSHVVRPAYTL
jgi:hypothetical protein